MLNALAVHARRGRQRRQLLEGGDELRTAIRIARVIERVHADDDVVRAEHLGPAERQRQEDGVARRHVGRRDLVADRSAGPSGTGASVVSDEPPNADRSTSSSTCRATPSHAATARAASSSLGVALAVADGQRVQAEAVCSWRWPRPCRSRARRSAERRVMRHRDSDDRSRVTESFRRRACRDQMYLCSCSCTRDRQAVGEHPLRQRLRVEDAVHRRQMDRRGARRRASCRAMTSRANS